ncbi:MAG: 3-hydroxyacyl-ACP dehydratase [Proteobacteria bacterium]|nr:3-hydroxyacyl-ACP dehydratase [Pseudomonadota bacterium]
MSASIPYSVEELLPHEPPMVLLDEVVDWTDTGVRAAVAIRDDNMFAIAGFGVPAHVGIEFMAQTCGLFSGIEARRSGEPVKLGFLLGSRRYSAERDRFLPGERLEIEATTVFRDGPMAVFDCRIESRGMTLATAQLTLYRPDDPAAAME